MLFNSPEFAIFFPLVFAAYWLARRFEGPRVCLLLLASYVFYGAWDWRFLGLIAASTLLDFLVGRALSRTDAPLGRKWLLGVSLVGNLGTLGFFKYFNFFTQEAAHLLRTLGFQANEPTLQILLPVGISFYTFQTLSYTIDVYRRHLAAETSLLRFAVFVAFFPQLVAGPIVRASEFLPQLRRPPTLTREAFHSGLLLVFWGLTKKIVVADYLGRELVDPFWKSPDEFGGWLSLLAIWGYAMQIYGDFSGYSDCAIGLARMLGFELTKNFDSPYLAATPRDFWRRWHISLSTWLRDYLYISLGGNRGSALLTYRNLALTMLLGGLWHGASWMFVLWGAYQGALLIADRLADVPEARRWWLLAAQRVVMFQFVCLGWVLFRSATVADAGAVLSSLWQTPGEPLLGEYVFLALAFGFGLHILPSSWKERARARFIQLPPFWQGVAYALLLGLLLNSHSAAQPFIYFQS
ncbi:MAG: MBOAT family protein [Planctomycetaceae bacterium]|nr:MBOAT family protein [Planctomycetaceae bacterium]